MKRFLIFAIASSFMCGNVSFTKINPNFAGEEPKLYEINPIAQYKFDDESNLGKDSIGTYDLTMYGSGLTKGEDSDGSYLNFASGSMLYTNKENNFSNMLGDCTFIFKLKKSVTPGEWNPIFSTGNGYTEGLTLFGASGCLDAKFKSADNMYSVSFVDGIKWNTVLMTLNQKQGIFKLYVDGNEVTPNAPINNLKNFIIGSVDFAFAIGGRWNLWSNQIVENTCSNGSIRDFCIYNAYLNETGVTSFFNDGKVKVQNRPINWQSSFSNIQGENCYFYAYGFPTKYRLMEWGFINATDEQAWRVGHGDWFQQIEKSQMSPGLFRWSTLKIWVADRDGIISLEGDILKLRTDENAMGDGIDTAIWMNGRKLTSHHFIKTESTPFDVKFNDMPVKKGDTIVFELHAGQRYSSANDYAAFRTEIFWEEKGDNFVENEDLTKYLSLAETEAEMLDVIIVPLIDGDWDKE